MKIEDLSKDTVAKFQKLIDSPDGCWFEVETPYLDSNGDVIKISFIHEPKDKRIGSWFSVTDNGLLDRLKLGEFLHENFWPDPLNEYNDYHIKTESEFLGKTIIDMAKFISGISNMVKAHSEPRRDDEG